MLNKIRFFLILCFIIPLFALANKDKRVVFEGTPIMPSVPAVSAFTTFSEKNSDTRSTVKSLVPGDIILILPRSSRHA
jgi:hypothetical protein